MTSLSSYFFLPMFWLLVGTLSFGGITMESDHDSLPNYIYIHKYTYITVIDTIEHNFLKLFLKVRIKCLIVGWTEL